MRQKRSLVERLSRHLNRFTTLIGLDALLCTVLLACILSVSLRISLRSSIDNELRLNKQSVVEIDIRGIAAHHSLAVSVGEFWELRFMPKLSKSICSWEV